MDAKQAACCLRIMLFWSKWKLITTDKKFVYVPIEKNDIEALKYAILTLEGKKKEDPAMVQ